MMRTQVLLVVAVCGFSIGGAWSMSASTEVSQTSVRNLAVSQTAPPFRGTVDSVPVFATVTDKQGQILTGLMRDQFEVRDQGKVRPITVFDNSPQPIRLTILIDVSGSMAGNLPVLRAACAALVSRLRDGDLARIGTFGDDVSIDPTFTRDPRALVAALPEAINPNAGTPIWRAVSEAVGGFDTAEGRRVVLILSDGKDSGPMLGRRWVSQPQASERAVREDVMIYAVALQSRPAGGLMPRPGEDLRGMMASTLPDPGLGRISEETGGGYIEIRPRDNLAAAFTQVADELHQQYLLAFAPSARDGKTHKIDVRVNVKDADVRARRTYQAAK